jgi:hypothetical protein
LPAFFFAVFLAAFFFVAMLRLLQELTKGTALQRPALASRVSNRRANRPSSRILRRDPRFRGANPTGKAMLRRGSGRSSAPATALSARAPALPEQPGRQRASPLSSPVASASPSRRDAWPSPALWLASPSGPRLPSSQRAAPCRARRTSSLRVSPSPALRLASAWRERQPSSSYLPSLPCPCSRQIERTKPTTQRSRLGKLSILPHARASTAAPARSVEPPPHTKMSETRTGSDISDTCGARRTRA